MLKITKPAPNRLDIELSGALDAEMMRVGLDELMAKSADVSQGRILYRIPEFALPSLGALSVELQRLPKLFALLGRFERCAVLSDAGWIRTAAEFEGALLPGIEIKGFALEEREVAEAWLALGAA